MFVNVVLIYFKRLFVLEYIEINKYNRMIINGLFFNLFFMAK